MIKYDNNRQSILLSYVWVIEMKMFRLQIEECDAKEQIEEQLNDFRFENEGKYLYLEVMMNDLPTEEKLNNFLKWLNQIPDVLVMSVQFLQNQENIPTIIFGDVEENMTIYTAKDIKICGSLKGKIFSNSNIQVYANRFEGANLFIQNEHFYVENEKNCIIKKNN